MTGLQKTRLKIVGAPLALLFAVFIIWVVAGKSPELTAPGETPDSVDPMRSHMDIYRVPPVFSTEASELISSSISRNRANRTACVLPFS